jgi:5-formyltetrahydrofolate cyclo-ligase
MEIQKAKAGLRAEMASIRLRPDERTLDSAAICEHVKQLPEWASSQVVLLFAALPDEPDVVGLWDESKQICLPRFRADRSYEAAHVGNLADLVSGQFGILEPPGSAICAGPSEVDLVVAPGIAFDTAGFRLGRGRGFYDRWLEGLTAYRCGIGFDHQLVSDVPHELHDARMGVVVTPSGAFRSDEA